MMLRSTIFILLVLFSPALWAQPFLNISASSTKLLPSVVKIKVQRSEPIPDESELIQNESGGSGFIFDSDHHVLTNTHVIKDAKKIVVVDINNTEHPAILIAKDDKTDIAILEVPTFNAPLIPVADSTQLALGDTIFAIGSPYSLGLGVTVGVVSALQRYLPNYPYQYFIQTDTAINPGNSGGPVFNQNGELIAVATMTFSKAGSYTNIGFAIPINEAIRIGTLLIAQKKIDRGYLGATLLISDKVSRKLGYQSSLLVTYVDPKSPAKLSGLRAGDLLTRLNDEKFFDNGALHRYLAHSKPNDVLTLTYIRDKKLIKSIVKLGTTPANVVSTNNIGTADQAEKLGLILEDGSGDESVQVVLSYGPAKTSGFTTGDKIIQINTIGIKTLKELNTQLAKLKETEIAMITFYRNGELVSLPLASKTVLQGYTTSN